RTYPDGAEQRIAAPEAAVGSLSISTGQAATTGALTNIAEAGDHILVGASLYGGTDSLLRHTFPKLGIDVTFVSNPNDPAEWREKTRPNTKAFFAETVGNPRGDVLDIRSVADAANEHECPLIVAHTVATPY